MNGATKFSHLLQPLWWLGLLTLATVLGFAGCSPTGNVKDIPSHAQQSAASLGFTESLTWRQELAETARKDGMSLASDEEIQVLIGGHYFGHGTATEYFSKNGEYISEGEAMSIRRYRVRNGIICASVWDGKESCRPIYSDSHGSYYIGSANIKNSYVMKFAPIEVK